MYKFEIKSKDKVVLITLKRLISLEESYKIFEDLTALIHLNIIWWWIQVNLKLQNKIVWIA